MDRNYLLRKIEACFEELGLTMDYLKNQQEETLRLVESYAANLLRVKRKCRTLPSWALQTFNRILENRALRATLMAGNIPLLLERKEAIRDMETRIDSIAAKTEEFGQIKQDIISTLNMLKSLSISSANIESEFNALFSSEKQIEEKEFDDFSEVERDIDLLLKASHTLMRKLENERKTLLSESHINTIPEIQTNVNLIDELERLGVHSTREKEQIAVHKKALVQSTFDQWDQIFQNLRDDAEALRLRIDLAGTLRNDIMDVENAGILSLSDVWTLYKTGDLLKADHELKSARDTYQRMKEEADGRKKIAASLLEGCMEILKDIPHKRNRKFAKRCKNFSKLLEESETSPAENLLDELTALKAEMEKVAALWLEIEEKKNEAGETASTLRRKIEELKEYLYNSVDELEVTERKKENIDAFAQYIDSIGDEISSIADQLETPEQISEKRLKSVINKLVRIDARIEDTKREISSFVEVDNAFIRYGSSFHKLCNLVPEESKNQLEKDFCNIQESLKEHLFDRDVSAESLGQLVEQAEISLREKEVLWRESVRRVEKMRNELKTMVADFFVMGYPHEAEKFENEIQESLSSDPIPTEEEQFQELEEKKLGIADSMKQSMQENLNNEIGVLERIRKGGTIKRYQSLIEEIIEITERYEFSELNERAAELMGVVQPEIRDCPYLDCGKSIEGNVRFCPFCGKEVILCPVCHNYNKKESRYCTHDGRLLKIKEYLIEILEKNGSVSHQDLTDLNLEEKEARLAIQKFFDDYFPVVEEELGFSIEMIDCRILKIKKNLEEEILELLPVHGTVSADDLANCSHEDIVNFYQKYKDVAEDELGYKIELMGDMIVRK